MQPNCFSAILATAIITSPTYAHHSHAMFDSTMEVTIDGRVSGYVFSNPHSFLYVDVEEENGEIVQYWIEMLNIPTMLRRGMNANTFMPGEAVTLSIHPFRDGRPGGGFQTVTDADGNTYFYE